MLRALGVGDRLQLGFGCRKICGFGFKAYVPENSFSGHLPGGSCDLVSKCIAR